eukprot:6325783-Prymnesium_polylepis.1
MPLSHQVGRKLGTVAWSEYGVRCTRRRKVHATIYTRPGECSRPSWRNSKVGEHTDSNCSSETVKCVRVRQVRQVRPVRQVRQGAPRCVKSRQIASVRVRRVACYGRHTGVVSHVRPYPPSGVVRATSVRCAMRRACAAHSAAV